MTKKTQTQTTEAPETDTDATPAVEPNDNWTRQVSLQMALDHHRTNGGMLTPPQVLDIAKQFNAYITGETK